MDNQNYTTERRKGQHLTDEERYFIQYALKQGMNKNQIAKAFAISEQKKNTRTGFFHFLYGYPKFRRYLCEKLYAYLPVTVKYFTSLIPLLSVAVTLIL